MKICTLTCMCADVFDGTDKVYPGGESLNFAANICREITADIVIVGAVGNDRYGSIIRNSIKNMPISQKNIHVLDCESAYNITYLTNKGDRYYKEDSWHGGAYDKFVMSSEDVSEIASADIVHTSIYCHQFGEVIELKKQHGFRLAVDFNDRRDTDSWYDILPYVDYFFISADEETEKRVCELSGKFSGVFTATLGENGSASYINGERIFVPAVPAANVVDTTGCGDSYQAGFIAEIAGGGSIAAAMKKGAELAAKTLSHFGGF